MKAVTYVVIILSFFSTPAFAGSVLDDLFNLASLGRYHQEYEEAKARVRRDLSHEQAVLQSNLNEVSADKELHHLRILESQYALATINYERATKFSSSQMKIMKMIEDLNLKNLRSANQINLSLNVADDLKETYRLLTAIKDVRFDSKYIESVQNLWLDSLSKIGEIAKRNQKNSADFLNESFMNLDKQSIEYLYQYLANFQENVTAKLVSNYRESLVLLAKKYNGQLKIVKSLGKGLELKEKELPEGVV
ncbi:MAG: hypothetical protein IPL83_08095 [Bdellovibrionales bacterium]|nr:hypothetical protein [Bdellovibrionales bacterium]